MTTDELVKIMQRRVVAEAMESYNAKSGAPSLTEDERGIVEAAVILGAGVIIGQMTRIGALNWDIILNDVATFGEQP